MSIIDGKMVHHIGYDRVRVILRNLGMDIKSWSSGDVTLPTGAYLARDSKRRWMICGYMQDGSDVMPYLTMEV